VAAVVLDGFRGGGENTFGLGGAFLPEGVFGRVDADLRITGGDLTLGLRTTPETVRLRTGVGAADSFDLADKAEIGDLVEAGCEDGRRCGVAFVFWSCWANGFLTGCLDEDSEAGVNNFALTR
jgi:hypothetical protein